MSGACENIHGFLAAYAAGDVSEAEAEAVRLHLSVCPVAREELREIRDVLGMLPPAPGMSEGALARLREAVRAATAPEATESDRVWLKVCGAEVSWESLEKLRRGVRAAVPASGARAGASAGASVSRRVATPNVYMSDVGRGIAGGRVRVLLAASAAAVAIAAGAWYAVFSGGGTSGRREAAPSKEIAKGGETTIVPGGGDSGVSRRDNSGDGAPDRGKDSGNRGKDSGKGSAEETGEARAPGGGGAAGVPEAGGASGTRDGTAGASVRGGAEGGEAGAGEAGGLALGRAADDGTLRETGGGKAKPGAEGRLEDDGRKTRDAAPSRGVEPIPAPRGGPAIVVDRPGASPRATEAATPPADGKDFVPSETPAETGEAALLVGSVVGRMSVFAEGAWRDLETGEKIPPASRIATGDGCRGAVAVAGRGILYLNQGTRLSLSAGGGKLTVLIEEGHLAYAPAGKSPPLPMAILSAAGRVEMAQGEIEAAVLAPGDRLRVVLIKGTATISGKFKPVAISGGEMAMARAGEMPEVQKAPDVAMQRTWRADIRVPAQYLSKDLTSPGGKSGRKEESSGGGREGKSAPATGKVPATRKIVPAPGDSKK
ncbi:MAG: zf-HC2 domain-containing protein [Planctomycetota bacterium]|nr:zf-HC2 domain-containing protein [Planctomycetota bacterium]